MNVFEIRTSPPGEEVGTQQCAPKGNYYRRAAIDSECPANKNALRNIS
jgi:hypothetical protein